ncbi:MAG: YceI family protein [Xanthomonadales bacterium]|nr:YceI family protein [Xanthomonadales bacterium]
MLIWQKAGLCLAVLLLGACFRQPLPDLSQLPEQPTDFPVERYRKLAGEGWSVLQVDPSHSELRIRVCRTGRMARLGHNHIVSASRIGGLAARDGDTFTADLYLAVADLEVDRDDLREAAGPDFDSDLTKQDKTDTRANMLSEKVLAASGHPFLAAELAATELASGRAEYPIDFRIRERHRTVNVPLKVDFGSQVEVRGRFSLAQSAFGLEPFSILGGAIGVADELEIEFELVFVPATGG